MPSAPLLIQFVKTEAFPVLRTRSVSFAKTLYEAYYKLEVLDAYCRILMLVRQLGQVNLLSQGQMVDLLKLKAARGQPDERLPRIAGGWPQRESQPFLAGLRLHKPRAHKHH